MTEMTHGPRTSVASRLLGVLGSFDAEHRSLTLTELSKRSGLPLPTTYRLVSELAEWGAIKRLESGQYVVGRRVWDLGNLAPVQTGLRQLASPFLNDLHAATRATVHLAVRDGAKVLYVDRLSGHVSVPIVSQIGDRLPMHATGVGKVLLAHATADVRDEAFAHLSRMTPYTITMPGRLAQDLLEVRKRGYATTVEEMSLGACSVAVPVHRPDGSVVAALGIVVATFKRDRAKLVSALQVAAHGIGRTVGPS